MLMVFCFQYIYIKPIIMTLIDQTLAKIRLLESDNNLLTEISQGIDEYILEVQAFYKSQGVNVSDKVIRAIINILGVEDAKTEAGANLAQKIKKNPKRMLLTVLDSGVMDGEELKDLLNQKANPSGDANIETQIDKLIDLLTSVEDHASGIHSAGITTSGDVYRIRRLIENFLGDDEESKKMVPALIKFLEQQINGEEPPLYKEDATGKAVVLLSNGQTGTVMVDSDDPELSQEFLDAVGNKMQRVQDNFALNLEQVKATPHHVWVYIPAQQEIVNVDKSVIAPNEFKPIMNNIMRDPTIEAAIAKFENETVRNKLAKSFGKVQSVQRDMDQMNRARGYDIDRYKQIMGVEGATNGVKLEITDTNRRSAAIRVLQWLSDNMSSASSINIGGSEIALNGSVKGNVIEGNDWRITFYRQGRSLTNITEIILKNISEIKYNSFENYKRANALNLQANYDAGQQQIIINNLR